MNIEDWTTQLKKGALEYCILLSIRERPCYGYEIMNQLSTWPIVSPKESTIYPLLRRLLKEGCVEATWKDSNEGLPPRKYYEITPSGLEYLQKMSGEWDKLATAITHLRNDI